MIPASLCAMLIGSSVSAGGLITDTNIDVDGHGAACTAKLTINADGTLTRAYTGASATVTLSSGPSNWFTPTTGAIGSSYQARFTPDGTSAGANTGTLADSTWTTISTAKTIICASNNTLGGLLEFRLLTSGVMLTSGGLYMSADDGI